MLLKAAPWGAKLHLIRSTRPIPDGSGNPNLITRQCATKPVFAQCVVKLEGLWRDLLAIWRVNCFETLFQPQTIKCAISSSCTNEPYTRLSTHSFCDVIRFLHRSSFSIHSLFNHFLTNLFSSCFPLWSSSPSLRSPPHT